MADGLDEDFDLKLVGDGISIDKKVNKQIAMAIVSAVLGAGVVPGSVSGEREGTDDQPPAKRSLSTREFLNECLASNNAEQITALGYYLCHHEAHESFSNVQIRDALQRARAVIPKNLSRDASIAVEKGWIHQTPGKSGRYYVTNTGMHLVESRFGRAK